MLEIKLPQSELYDEENNVFIYTEEVVLKLEHSLVSLSKWETKWEKPFLIPGERSDEEVKSYIESMTMSGNFSDEVYSRLTNSDQEKINKYIGSPNSGTTFNDTPQQKARRSSEVITSEMIYFWMSSYNVPYDCEHWHLNRLFNLLRISNVKNSKPKKMSKNEIAQRNRDLNAQRKAQLNTTG